MQPLSSSKIAEIVGSRSKVISVEISGVSTDSRRCGSHDVFIALKGEKFDGHNFAASVINAGCPLVIVDHLIDGINPEKQIVVPDTLHAYGLIGAYNRSLFKGKVIGLTGSSGKTTTKEELKFILSFFGKTYGSFGNHNNQVGVPESLCNLDMSADYAVIEMGMSSKGEISKLTSYVKPDVALVTNVYPMHIEFFNNFEEIAYAKAEIFEGLSADGTAVINADTNFADILAKQAAKYTSHIVKFGKDYLPKANFTTQEEREHYLYNAWAVLKVVQVLGLDVQKAASHIKDFGALEGRGKHYRLQLPDNKGTYTLIDDSYSGQPEAMKLAITSLDKMSCSGRKIAVLGKMAELGKLSKEKHTEIGKYIANTSIDIVIGVCPEMQDMLNELSVDQEHYYFADYEKVADFLLNKLLQKDDIVLIKGARYSSCLYKVAEELKEKGSK